MSVYNSLHGSEVVADDQAQCIAPVEAASR